MAQARSKVARETRSLRPVLMPLSLRCTKPALVSMPVTTTTWLSSLRSPAVFQIVWALTAAITLCCRARSCSRPPMDDCRNEDCTP